MRVPTGTTPMSLFSEWVSLAMVSTDRSYEDPIDLNNEIRERLSRIETLLLERQPILVTPPNPIPTNDNPHHRAGFIARGRYYGPSAMSHVGDGSATDLMKALNVSVATNLLMSGP